MKKIAFYTLGCKLNYAETSHIAQKFKQNGYTVVDDNEIADIYIINSCTVTKDAEKDCRQRVRHYLRKNPNAFIGVIGCYAQIRPDEIAAIDGVDIIVGNDAKYDLHNLINTTQKYGFPSIINKPTEELNSFGVAYSGDNDERTRAFLKVQDGCDYNCSYCTIPLARGKSRSLAPKEVISYINKILDNGYLEIVLTGVNVGDYAYNNYSFYDLLKEIDNIKRDFRIRISSIEPNLLTDDIIKLVSNSEHFANHFHIPLQSGNDKILAKMQRRYNTKMFSNVIDKIISNVHNYGLGIDVIVGFPDETDDDFLVTYNFLENIPFTYLHVFTYSERPSTKALQIENKVEKSIKKERNFKLKRLSDFKKEIFYNNSINSIHRVIFEHTNYDGIMKGYTDNYIRVFTNFDENFVNKFVKVKILQNTNNMCKVEII
ncbi:MAG TPA: tRNA (N(6)-L-threonylcarbamoyladenosine(37)-C(2))-methylthiotransferase MtaB [Ignavibacteriales bacterium]|nr:tRNA (N(6)-L-threonylcarbamoyladenosine(37)-C(2))-methylthiotransferase MtaB [Ignavibacteriales bacterium]HPD66872.1 tRNA (N(6)-L-threonylcarbamoyladenosine(37)-C(2))-methylthiotransferase MtaB [Ignavibacteriales bacterium]HRR18621.1 tRNA (N(6)-L-threonylcarbamoyladenosine(37)-C(2))-methylthiotransferase MtaB [Ignavibacteriales bacterium]